jgi:pyruvate/2-oxoglutarate dehydrogenase complex dihydrolipoamide dehydrogenase (E3) component
LHRFKEELTGPEYAERCIRKVQEAGVPIWCNTCAIDIIPKSGRHDVPVLSKQRGLVMIKAHAVILAMGCRERNRGNINIPGSRPAGIMTAGLAQKMVNLQGYLPGREIVILGSGDIGLIMARRLTWEGAKVRGVVEIQPYPGGLNRNIVQCLNDFDIPLYLSHTITAVNGNPRITSVDVAPLDRHHEPQQENIFRLLCDTLLLSVGLIPENELSLRAPVELDPVTRGAKVDQHCMSNVPGIFACGNVLHVHDLADWVSEEAARCGTYAAAYLKGTLSAHAEVPVESGHLVRYVLPSRLYKGTRPLLSLRPVAPAHQMTLLIETDSGVVLAKRKCRKIFPSVMERVTPKTIPDNCQHVTIRFEGQIQ